MAMKYWLCVEDGERFIAEAGTESQARSDAQMWNGELIRELTKAESKEYKKKGCVEFSGN